MNQQAVHQRMVNEAYRHLEGTQRKSANKGNAVVGCLYAGSGCAFAPMIKKGMHQEADNQSESSIGNVMANAPQLVKKWVLGCDPNFAADLQQCHDNAKDNEFFASFCGRLANLCDVYCLKMPEPRNFAQEMMNGIELKDLVT